MRTFTPRLLALAACICASAFAQTVPLTNGTGSAPDDWLLIKGGPAWWYRTAPSARPVELKKRDPDAAEQRVVDKARRVFSNRAAKAIALLDGDSVVYTAFKAPADDESVFHGFSMGKTVTAMGVGQAICAGKLALTTRADEVVPELKGKALGAATVRDLLRMGSGAAEPNADSTIWGPGQFAEWKAGTIDLVKVVSEDRVAKAGRGMFSDYKPDEHFSYKSTDPYVLGIMVGRVTGVPFSGWVQGAVLDPMGAANAGWYSQDRQKNPLSDSGLQARFDDWLRFAVWVKRSSKEAGCMGDFVRDAMRTQIENPGSVATRKTGKLFAGYGYFTWTDNTISPNTAWASGWGGQRISWHKDSDRMLVVFSNVEDWMAELYELDKEWGLVGR